VPSTRTYNARYPGNSTHSQYPVTPHSQYLVTPEDTLKENSLTSIHTKNPPLISIHDSPIMAPGDSLPDYLTNTILDPSFDKDMLDTHLVYEYDAQDNEGNPMKWRYEMWICASDCIAYDIHSGPMAGRKNYQRANFQCIRPGELWQINWLEETGTVVSVVYDIRGKKMTTMIAFSEGHWKRREEALGDKRNKADRERWGKLADVGNQASRFMLSEQGTIVEVFKGRGNMAPIEGI